MSIDLGILFIAGTLWERHCCARSAEDLRLVRGIRTERDRGFFEAIGFRPGSAFAAMAGLSEFVGGALLLLGLFTPLGAAAVLATMIVAAVSVHLKSGFFATGNGIEVTFLYGSTALALTFFGGGAFSLDALLAVKFLTERYVAFGVIGVAIVSAGVVLAMRARPQDQPTTT